MSGRRILATSAAKPPQVAEEQFFGVRRPRRRFRMGMKTLDVMLFLGSKSKAASLPLCGIAAALQKFASYSGMGFSATRSE